MNFNIIGYGIYLPVTFYVTVLVGRALHQAGRHYVCEMTEGNETLTDAINNALLVGYYLMNLGYIALMMSSWEQIASLPELLYVLCDRIGTILLTLGLMHFLNMFVLKIYNARHIYHVSH